MTMRDLFNVRARRWIAVGGLLLLMSIASVDYVRAVGLTDEEIDSLAYIREEEKLARDVYLFLHDNWGSLIFEKISVSEQTHMDAVATLLDRYGLDDPAAGNDLGVFDNPELQDLYTKLINGGNESLIHALRVGVFIEMTDIADLTQGIATARHKDIKTVYTNLRKGSQNHWDAFCSHLAKVGEACDPYELP